MPRKQRILTDLECEKAKLIAPSPENSTAPKLRKLYLHENGVYLLIDTHGKYWRMKYHFNGKEKLLALGVFPQVKIADQVFPPIPGDPDRKEQLTILGVRTKAHFAKMQITNGIDPMEQRKAAKQALRLEIENMKRSTKNTFAQVANRWLELMIQRNRQTRKNAGIIKARLQNHIYPHLGDMPIDQIQAANIHNIYDTIIAKDIISTANRVIGYLTQIFDWASAQEPPLATSNPADLWKKRKETAPEKVRHHPALIDRQGLSKLVQAIYDPENSVIVGSALKMLLLTFVRPGQLLLSEWTEIDFEKRQWITPKCKMKMKDDSYDDHIIPLSQQAIGILTTLKALTGNEKYVFHNSATKRPITDAALRKVLGSHGITNKIHHLHGFRVTASTLLREEFDVRQEYIEHQLHHKIKDANGTAYNRATFLPERRVMMQNWSNYIDKFRQKSDTIDLNMLNP